MDQHKLRNVLDEVAQERRRQHDKWGEQNHQDGTGGTPIAHVLRTLCNYAAADGSVTWAHILGEEFGEALDETDPATLRAELVQVAAVVVQWIEAIDRRRPAVSMTEDEWGSMASGLRRSIAAAVEGDTGEGE